VSRPVASEGAGDDAAVTHILRDLGARSVRLLIDGGEADERVDRSLRSAGLLILGRRMLDTVGSVSEGRRSVVGGPAGRLLTAPFG
jgi:hypothetical protein